MSIQWGHDQLDPAALALLYALPTRDGGGCAGMIELFKTGMPIPIMSQDLGSTTTVPLQPGGVVWGWEIECNGGTVVAFDGPGTGAPVGVYPLPGGATLRIFHGP